MPKTFHLVKIITLLLFGFTSQIIKSQPKNYKNTENTTLKDAFPKNHEGIAPGCLTKEQLKDLKLFLNNNWNTNLDSIKTLHFYYSTHEIVCKYIEKISEEKNKYFPYGHTHNVTSIYKPLLFIKKESVKAESFWKDDISDFFFNLILRDYHTKFDAVSITINSNGIYFIKFEGFNPIVFNAFSYEVNKYQCD